MRWMFLGGAAGGLVSLWGVGPGYTTLAAFVVLFVNFATFCLLYDRPKDRARQRTSSHLQTLNPNSDVAQRLSTAPITVSAADRKLGFGPMTLLNLASGVAGIGLLVWGAILRIA